MKKIAVFADVQNIYYTCRQAYGRRFNYRALIERIETGGEIVAATGDWDVGIAIDVMDAAAGVDIVVLLSGDGDFDLLLKRVRDSHGVRTEVYGVPALTANALIDAASLYHRIDETLLL